MARPNLLLSLLKHVPTIVQVFKSLRGDDREMREIEERLASYQEHNAAHFAAVEKDIAGLRARMIRLDDTLALYKWMLVAASSIAALALLAAIIALAK
jgi:hypothetical protein